MSRNLTMVQSGHRGNILNKYNTEKATPWGPKRVRNICYRLRRWPLTNALLADRR